MEYIWTGEGIPRVVSKETKVECSGMNYLKSLLGKIRKDRKEGKLELYERKLNIDASELCERNALRCICCIDRTNESQIEKQIQYIKVK